MKPRLVEEKSDHYVMHDGKAAFRVPFFGLSPDMHSKIRGMSGGGEVRRAAESASMGAGGRRQLSDVLHKEPLVGAPPERPEQRQLRAEPVEHPRIESDPDFEVQRAHGGRIPGYSEGGDVPDDGAGGSRPDVIEPRRDPGHVVYVSETPTPGSVPVQAGDSGAGGGPGWYGPGTVARRDMGSGGAEGGAPGNQIPPNEEMAMRANAATAPTPQALPRGVVPRGQEPAEPTAQAAPANPGRVYAGPSSSGEMSDAVRAEQQALIDKGAAEAQQARQTAAALADQRAQLQQSAIAQREQQTRARTSASEMMGQYKQQLDEMRKTDTGVDPGRFWATRTTAQKVLGIIGLALGAVGAGRDGVNRAAGMMSQAIDRDIEAQKAETEARLRKGGAALQGAQQMYALNRQLFQDDIAATAASKATALELADNQLKQISATASSPIAKANAAALSAQLQQAKAKFDADLQNRAAELGIKREANRIDEEKVMLAGAKGGVQKNAELARGAIGAVDDLERELKNNPTSPRIAQLRASVLLHMNKLQGGRFNEEINKMNQALVPGNEGLSISTRLAEKLAPGLMGNKFDTVRKHITATANSPPNPAYEEQ